MAVPIVAESAWSVSEVLGLLQCPGRPQCFAFTWGGPALAPLVKHDHANSSDHLVLLQTVVVVVHLQVFWEVDLMSHVQAESVLGCCGFFEGGMMSDWELWEVDLWAFMGLYTWVVPTNCWC